MDLLTEVAPVGRTEGWMRYGIDMTETDTVELRL